MPEEMKYVTVTQNSIRQFKIITKMNALASQTNDDHPVPTPSSLQQQPAISEQRESANESGTTSAPSSTVTMTELASLRSTSVYPEVLTLSLRDRPSVRW